MSMKIKFAMTLIVLASLIATGLLVMQTNEYKSGSENIYTQADFMDVSDDRVLVGAAHNVFIGKVVAQTGSKPNTPPVEAGDVLGFSPQTQVSVEVLENIKGNLNGTITVSQYGGYEEKSDASQLVLIEDDKLLEPGKTYLFATRFNDIDGWDTIIVPNYGDIPVKDQVDYNNKRERFNNAFEQEIPLKEQKQP